MRGLNLDEGWVGDAVDLLEALAAASDEKRPFRTLLSKLQAQGWDQPLSEDEVEKTNALLEKYAKLVDKGLWRKVKDRIRKRRQRAARGHEHRVLVSEETMHKLERMKNRTNSEGSRRYSTYDEVIIRLLKAYEDQKNSRSKKRKARK